MGDLSKNFSRSEFACTGWTKDGGSCACPNVGIRGVDTELVKILQHLRDECGSPVSINSAFRCPARNKAVGGASNSQHLYSLAADVWVGSEGSDPSQVWTPNYVVSWLRHHYPKASHGAYNTFTHIDVRENGPVFWDNRTNGGAFPSYTPPDKPLFWDEQTKGSPVDRITVLEAKVGHLEDELL